MKIPHELRNLVSQTVSILGQIIEDELGPTSFKLIEELRLGMTTLRKLNERKRLTHLQKHFAQLKSHSAKSQMEIAHSFTLMLELINTCENAFRSHRLQLRSPLAAPTGEKPNAIIYVLTAHPTEARSPQNICIFHLLQKLLIEILHHWQANNESKLSLQDHQALRHFLQIAWRTPIVRNRKPKVKDEAQHIYSLFFRKEVLFSLLDRGPQAVPFFVRSWVGGDKDGHPGVNEKTLLQSLTLSRRHILQLLLDELEQIAAILNLVDSEALHSQIFAMKQICRRLRLIKANDGKVVCQLRASFAMFKKLYLRRIGALHPGFQRLTQIVQTFPGLVMPLELRESSEILMTTKKSQKSLAIYKMLSTIEKISKGGNPRWYARGFIISMASSMEHIQAAATIQRAIFAQIPIPIIPLFEEASSLAGSASVIRAMATDVKLRKAIVQNWENLLEMMVGYSDSAKESGVLASRVQIANTLPVLENVCKQAQVTPVFFHGSGGSIDRGGGSIEDQTAWWPKSALRKYKVTIQGEMVERSLASASIAERQIESIIESATKALKRKSTHKKNLAVEVFATKIAEQYRNKISSAEFLRVVECATPYSYLNFLKIGSRPTKRVSQLKVQGLRAIPWVLCWTQARVLFPTWWGIGTAWKQSSPKAKQSLQKAFHSDPVFTSFIKALGFTLAKVEMSVWWLYLEHSGLSLSDVKNAQAEFAKEFAMAKQCYAEICQQTNLMWFRPWLGESITLRSSMIHPLNLLQIVAMKQNNLELLRLTVTGISSGMLTTG